MPTPTFTLIASNTLSSSAASVTFSSIPQTYTDLVLRTNIRTDASGVFDILFITINFDTSAKYSLTRLNANGATASSSRQSAASPTPATGSVYWSFINGAGATNSTFGSSELYFPNYTGTASKAVGATSVTENNATTAYIHTFANLYTGTAAITSLLLEPQSAQNFVAGSLFFLYGIKNS